MCNSSTLEVGQLGGEDGAENARPELIRGWDVIEIMESFVYRGRVCS